LPKTASPVPLLGLIGLLSIAAGLGLSVISKRIV
jgi:LPXTG-motif cell wall-anchored protein